MKMPDAFTGTLQTVSFLAGALNYNESDGLDDLDTLQLTAERMLIEAKLPGSFPWAWHRLWGNNPTKVIVGGPIG